MPFMFKYLLCAIVVVLCCLQEYCLGQSSTVRPYKFGFTIDQQQHRSEQRDERGIVMGEFGFITADGIYHVTVYATDEQGRFRILAMKNYPYESPPKTIEVMVKPKIPMQTKTSPKPLTKHNFNTEACSGCFLKNGNAKPKDVNNIQEKPLKNGIRPLSKSLGSEAKVPASPKLPIPPSSENKAKALVKQNTNHYGTNTAKTPPNTLKQQTPLNNSPQNSKQTKTTAQQGNTLDNAPLASSVLLKKDTPHQSSSPQTYNTNSGQSQTNTISKDTNQQSPKPVAGGSSLIPASGSINPPIMDIIMQKVLPTLMDSKDSTPSVRNSQPNVVPSVKKSDSSPGINSKRSGSSAAGSDGDLYRFKYNLDYHGHSETGKRNGDKEGTYYAIGDDNVERTIEYVANEFGYQPRIRWRKLDANEIKSKENTLKDYEFVWFN